MISLAESYRPAIEAWADSPVTFAIVLTVTDIPEAVQAVLDGLPPAMRPDILASALSPVSTSYSINVKPLESASKILVRRLTPGLLVSSHALAGPLKKTTSLILDHRINSLLSWADVEAITAPPLAESVYASCHDPGYGTVQLFRRALKGYVKISKTPRERVGITALGEKVQLAGFASSLVPETAHANGKTFRLDTQSLYSNPVRYWEVAQ